jgi:Ca2+-binding RTX toxin-like protein
VRLVLFVTAFLLLAVPSAMPAALAPPNDNFADAVDLNAIADTNGFVRANNVNATAEPLEPNHAGQTGGKSIWYSWTAPGDGSIPHVAFLAGGDFDTLLGVYTGPAVGALTPIASNDDVAGFGGGSSVSFATVAGTTYHIAIDGFLGKSGVAFLEWRESPANDNFADAFVLSGASGSRTGDTANGATTELGEDVFAALQSVWYEWTPPVDGTYKFSTVGSGFDTLMAIYSGTVLEDLELIDVNDDDPDRGCCSSWIGLVDAVATTTYYINVSPLSLEAGPLNLSWGPLILGDAAPNVITGTPAAEEIRGLGGEDILAGAGGADLVFGGRGNDSIRGGPANDLVFDRTGLDLLRGDSGNDVLDARDRARGDRLIGGPGVDNCRADRTDVRSGC